MLPVLVLPILALAPLGMSRVGILLTTLSLLGIVAMADLGASASVITRVARYAAAGDERLSHRAQAEALLLAAAMGCITAVAGMIIALGDVGHFVFPRSSSELQQEATLAIAIFVIANGLHMPLAVAYRIRHALHEGHFANSWQALAALINFAAGVACLYTGHGVPALVAALMAGSLGLGVMHAAIQLRRDAGVRRALASTSPRQVVEFVRYSGPYFGTQIIFAVAYSLDATVVAMLLGAESAARYALADRIFSTITILISVRTLRIWALFSSFMGQDKRLRAVQLLRVEFVKLSLIATAMAAGLSLSFPILSSRFGLRVGDVTVVTLLGMALWRVIESAGGAVAAFMYSVDAARFVVITGTATAILALTLKILLCQRFGISAIPLSMSVIYIGCSLIPCILFIRAGNRRPGEMRVSR